MFYQKPLVLSLAIVVTILILSCGQPSENTLLTQESSVYNGLDNDHPSVGMYSSRGDVPGCSATIIKGRCALTAAHCLADGRDKLFMDAAPTVWSPGIKVLRDIGLHTSGSEYIDLAVLWLSSKECDYFGACRDATFDPMPVAIGEFPPTGVPGVIIGYGLGGPAGPGGKKRSGVMSIYDTTNAFFTGSGGYTTLAATAGYGQFTCSGDSGGPLIKDGKVYGVDSKGAGGSCGTPASITSMRSYYTSFTNGNDTWLTKQLNEFCIPKVRLFVYVVGQGSVTVNNSAGATVFTTTVSGSTELKADTFTAKATASPGWQFDKWEDSIDRSCPCHGSTSTTCVVNASTFDASNTTGENASCNAKFVQIPPPSPTATPTPTATGTSSPPTATTPVMTPTPSP